MAAASSRTWRGAAQRASRSTSLRAQSAKFAVTGALAALIDVSLTWLLQIGFGLLSADPARAVASLSVPGQPIYSIAAGPSRPKPPRCASPVSLPPTA
ncbi:hypothetical protein QP900_08225 [Corynebacterium marquesiae]|uniref:hypothetical protein n=1 Tax=Corynebacterium marquesiae TaxID=2913503 RepID=UPI00254DCC91|nr:hypothetical protein [Corynebacterium marquesiae]MDK8532087.1 hypothetical protein [Corynebacterium marquesiae]MDK8669043.1 hypothetical protein [Corynebacterium marquesiae]